MIEQRTIFEIHRMKGLGLSLRAIARNLKVARKTVLKYLENPNPGKPTIKRASKIDPFKEEIGRMLAEPCGAAETGPTLLSAASGLPGRKGAKCERTATGPTPGPPPPCGMQKVLCRFKCETSDPNLPGLAVPTSAFMLAPSMYTWPPAAWMMSQISVIESSNTPCVEG